MTERVNCDIQLGKNVHKSTTNIYMSHTYYILLQPSNNIKNCNNITVTEYLI